MKKKIFVLKEISPLAAAKTSALFLASVIGLVGFLVIFGGLFRSWKSFSDAVLGTLFGIFILSPVYGVVVGILVILYNWAARKVGGYRVTLEVEEKEI